MCPTSNITMYYYNVQMNKLVIFSLFLMASLLMGTSLTMDMISTAMADEKDRDDKRYQHVDNDKYRQSTYEPDPYTSTMTRVMVMIPNHRMVNNNNNNHHMTYQDMITVKALTMTIVNTQLMIKNMSVEQVHLKDFL